MFRPDYEALSCFLALQGNPLSRSLLTELPGLDSSALRDRLVRLKLAKTIAYGIHFPRKTSFYGIWMLGMNHR